MPPASSDLGRRRLWVLRSLRWVVLIAAVVAILLLSKVAFPISPPGPPYFASASLQVTGDVRLVNHFTNGIAMTVLITVSPDENDMHFRLKDGVGMPFANYRSDIPHVSSESTSGKSGCWQITRRENASYLTRSAEKECDSSNEVRLSWRAETFGSSSPYAWTYVPPLNIEVDRRDEVNGMYVDLLEGPDPTFVSEYNLDLEFTKLDYYFHTGKVLTLRSARIFAAASDECVGVANSGVVSSWRCTPLGAKDAAMLSESSVSLPSAYSVFEQDGYESTREVALLVLGALLGLVGGGVYAELQALALQGQRRVTQSLKARD